MDDLGRLIPAENRFPSAAGGAGFRPLADYVHGKGLRFGLHVMRGIPREAVHRDLPVDGGHTTAAQIADRHSKCRWLNHMYGLNMTAEGAQDYYNSIYALYAEWGVDFIKADDLTNLHVHPELDPGLHQYAAAEIEAMSSAISTCGRPMVFSVSVGPTPLNRAEHVAEYANMWRVSADFWDRWPDLLEMFYYMRAWNRYVQPGSWPDADMIPFGRLSKNGPSGPERDSRFTNDEKSALFSLWAMARSPLMLGGNLPEYDEHSLSLVTNVDLIAINQSSTGNRELYNDGETIIWGADLPDGRHPVAVFNISDSPRVVSLADCGLEQIGRTARDMVEGEGEVALGASGEVEVNAHGVRVLAFESAPVFREQPRAEASVQP
jgi:hypothetical protein